ncbi:GAF domain-containing protein [Candidatus Margulisiibacteriota bacterium]
MPKRSSIKQVRALSEISRAITSETYLEDILRIIVTVTAEMVDSKICSLMLLDEKKKELIIKATQSVSDDYNKKAHIKLGQGIVGIVAEENKPIYVADVKSDKRYMNTAIAKKENLCSLLSIPLSAKGHVIGVLNVYTSEPRKFTKSEVDFLTGVANQSAVAIENTQLMMKAKFAQDELESRKVTERAKGILMKDHGLDENEAFKRIQKMSMDTRKSMREIAEAIILTKELGK